MKILIVEDEPKAGDYLRQGLREAGYVADLVTNGVDGLHHGLEGDHDLVILDVMLPGMDGWQVLRNLRSQGRQMPVLFLTARDQVDDRVKGLELGADDYLVKPFGPRELIARIKAMLRRPRLNTLREGGRVLVIGGLQIDPESRDVHVDGRAVELTPTEFELLSTLASRPRAAFTRRQIIDAVWGRDWFGDDHIVDVHVGNLRKKLDDNPGEPRFVRTVRGVGYTMGTG